MPFDLETIAKSLNSPPGQIAAGVVLGGIIWNGFKRVGDVLSESNNVEIANWIKHRSVGVMIFAGEAENWPATFAKVFDRVFGEKHLSWKCFWRSCAASLLFACPFYLYAVTERMSLDLGAMPVSASVASSAITIVIYALPGNVIPDYLSLLETRAVLRLMQKHGSGAIQALLLVLDLVLTATIAVVFGVSVLILGTRVLMGDLWSSPHFWGVSLFKAGLLDSFIRRIFIYPAFFTSFWLWLYAASGFLLKFVRRFDSGLYWVNRTFDIDKKPLQSMGVVAGVLVMLMWWGFALVAHLIK